ncbi:MAG: DMT family transporter [Hyphomicrobiaceae bacterium]
MNVKPILPSAVSEGASPVVRHHTLDALAISLLLLLCVLLAIGQVAIKVANAGISPLLQAGLRSFFAAILLGGFAWARGIKLFARDGILAPALLAGAFFAAEFACLYPGLARTTAAHAVILLYTSPFVVAVGAHFLIPGDRMTSPKVAGLIAAFVGVAVVTLGRSPGATGTQAPTLIGDLLCLAGALAWGLLTLTLRATRLAKVSPERSTFLLLAISAPMLCALSVALGEAGITDPNPRVLAAFAFTVVFVGFVCFTTTNWLLGHYPASKVMAFLLLTPVLGVLAGHVLLGEELGPSLLTGLALVLAGLWLVNRPARASPPAA